MEVIKRRERERERVIDIAKKWVSSLGFRLTAIMIGSYARGDFNLWSDVDILLISDELVGNPLERLRKLDPPPGFQIIPLTTREFKKLLERRDSMAREALRYGVFLRDDLGIGNM